MEVGAVKQAFNNEVILLKKKLDQAKIQIINKLTRKAKTLTQKKAPEHLAEKIKRKATAAVNDLMAIKKIHNKDIARFAITHTGKLNDFLNKPTSSPAERACARLLLHKALQDKYKLLRSRFADVPIKDLFMSRQERLKIKKEEKEKQKLKKTEKEERKRKRESEKKNEKTPVQAEGDWSVEDIDIDELILNKKFVPKVKTDDDNGNDDSEIKSDDESDITNVKQADISTNDIDTDGDSNDESEVEKSESEDEGFLNMSVDETDNEDELNNKGDNDSNNEELGDNQHSNKDDDTSKRNLSDAESVASIEADNESKDTKQTRFMKKTDNKTEKPKQGKPSNIKPVKEDNRKKLPKLNKDKTKTKIFPEKMHSRKTKTHSDDLETPQGNRIVDPFFITATGEHYMSVVEPRAPDEVKEVHKQGNRQIRRAALFGHVPKAKPRFGNNFSNHKNREHGNFSNDNGTSRFGGKNDKFDRQNGFKNRDSSHNKFENNDGYQKRDISNKNFKSNSFNSKAYGNQDKSHNFKRKFDAPDSLGKKSSEPEKLHPSWAAKKKMSSVQPFQGKKIVFE